MKREAFKMYLKPGCEAEYEKRHAAIWPEMKELLAKNGVTLDVTPAALGLIAKEGYDPEFGARPVKRVIHRHVLNPLSKELLAGTVNNEHPIVVDAQDGKLVFRN